MFVSKDVIFHKSIYPFLITSNSPNSTMHITPLVHIDSCSWTPDTYTDDLFHPHHSTSPISPILPNIPIGTEISIYSLLQKILFLTHNSSYHSHVAPNISVPLVRHSSRIKHTLA